MRRVVLAGGSLHVLGDAQRVVVQVRTPHLTTSEDTLGPACKVGVELDRREVFRLLGELVTLAGAMKGP
jgi:hypothetical protein